MSENLNEGNGGPGLRGPGKTQGQLDPTGYRALATLGTRVVGWTVSGVGLFAIVAAISFKHKYPNTLSGFILSAILLGASLVLAGDGISKKCVWALPLAMLPLVVVAIPISLYTLGIGLIFFGWVLGLIHRAVICFQFSAVVTRTGLIAWGFWAASFVILLFTFFYTTAGHGVTMPLFLRSL